MVVSKKNKPSSDPIFLSGGQIKPSIIMAAPGSPGFMDHGPPEVPKQPKPRVSVAENGGKQNGRFSSHRHAQQVSLSLSQLSFPLVFLT
jgi:hypothetical protein